MKKTALYAMHLQLNAKLAPFSGYEMPISYDKISNEYNAVRQKCGMFDVSHMGQIKITGDDASAFVQELTINNIEKLSNYEAQYSAMCNNEGGLLDDLIVLKFSSLCYILIVNASNKHKILDWMQLYQPKYSTHIIDMNKEYSLIALQGPQSRNILNQISSQKIDLPFYHLINIKLLNYDVILSRTGYTGELGFEILAQHDIIQELWKYFMHNNVYPAGLAVRDILRLEMKYCLYGNDIEESVNPIEAGLSWIIDFKKKSFIGKEKLLEIKSNKYNNKLCGFIMCEKAIPRKGYMIYSNNTKIGHVTSGTHSPTLSKGIGLGYIQSEYAQIGHRVSIKIRGKLFDAEIIKTPFINNTSLYD